MTIRVNLTPPGITCPCCHHAELALAADGGRPPLSCQECGVLVRPLRCHGDPYPALDPADAKADVPAAGSWWLGYVIGGNGIARPVALSQTLGGAWDGVLRGHLRGTIVIAPTDPSRMPEAAADEAQETQDREAA